MKLKGVICCWRHLKEFALYNQSGKNFLASYVNFNLTQKQQMVLLKL